MTESPGVYDPLWSDDLGISHPDAKPCPIPQNPYDALLDAVEYARLHCLIAVPKKPLQRLVEAAIAFQNGVDDDVQDKALWSILSGIERLCETHVECLSLDDRVYIDMIRLSTIVKLARRLEDRQPV